VLQSNSPDRVREFLKDGWKAPQYQDQRVRVAQIINAGGREVREAGKAALASNSPEEIQEFLTHGQNAARDVVGRVERGMAGLMLTRSGDNYPSPHAGLLAFAREAEGEHRSIGRYPVVDVAEAWEVRSMLEVTTPGVELAYVADGLTRTARLVHPDGSWARATAEGLGPAEVHEGGPRRLWQSLERIRNRLNAEGGLPLLGAELRITPDGGCHLSRGRWQASIGEQ